MRTLKFIVEGQVIKPDPECDFSNLISDTVGYLNAEFKFSDEWNRTSKVAGFYSPFGREYPPQVLNADNTCDIPHEALQKEKFKIQIFGLRGAEFKLTTNRIDIHCDN